MDPGILLFYLGGAPFSNLPLDGVNQSSTGLYYVYYSNGSQLIVTAIPESQKQKAALGTSAQIVGYPDVMANGSNMTISPLFSTSGLVGYWPMNEGAGSTATDQSGNGNNGTATGTVPYYTNASKTGLYAGNFNGTNDYVAVSDTTTLQLASAGTIVLWIYPTAYEPASSWRVMMSKGNWSGARNSYNIYYQSGSLVMEADAPSNANHVVSGETTTPLNTWTHLALTWNGANMYGYINGAQRSSSTMSGVPNTAGSNLYIGTPSGNNYYFSGYEDDIRLYNRALSPAEIQALYNAEK